ncbi:G protein-coupled receptor class C group 5 member A [Chelydra serpentina]|uniref:G protein-coupled receptor class C group 5 member A n=1 Tax=Chelydra serpentina TaxID=8475 RepID=A0A8T1S7Z6_CHESE|nr:G protein-coupled receptor class C group 5 member A [Chelydra serpentina]
MASTPPPGCNNNIDSDYYLLCDTEQAWGIVLETLATAGVIVTISFMLLLLIFIGKVQDSTKRSMIPIYFLFLLGTLGIFGLTFAFIIKLNDRTGPTRFFLFGVLFALCFSCLLTHAFNLVKLVRGKAPFWYLVLLVIAISLTVVQVIIAIVYVVVIVARQNMNFTTMSPEQRNMDFVMLLIYVLCLMALTFLVSMFTFCGTYKGWKRHGAHIYVTVLFSIAIWVVWITMLMRGNPELKKRPIWDDPVISIALVSNGWVFLMMYMVPEFCFLTRQCKPEDYPPENYSCQPKLMNKSFGVENQAYIKEETTTGPGYNGDTRYVPHSAHFQMESLKPQQEFTIPRPKTRVSPYEDYTGGQDTK